MPTSYYDQFYDMDPGVPPASGTPLTAVYHDFVDQDDNGDIEPGTDTMNGSLVTNVWVNDTITVTVGGFPTTITGTTFYTADGGRYFTPNDNSTLVDSIFQSSTFVNSSTSMPVGDFGPPCFVRGTMISTKHGKVLIEEIKVGDEVLTLDHGPQPIRWIGRTTVCGTGRFAPIEFAPGAIGNDETLLVSPQHRMLVGNWQSELYFGQPEVFVSAKHLVDDVAVTRSPTETVEYFHLLFDQHEVIWSNGVPTESFFPGDQILLQDRALRDELTALFPELTGISKSGFAATARSTIKAREAGIFRHAA